MEYNLLNEPWISVIDSHGIKSKMGIYELLQKADKLAEIQDASPMREYGVFRLLCAFLMDALRPETLDELEELLDLGHIDMSRIDSYLKVCEREGVSFDLFDKERPFLQSAFDTVWDSDKNIKPVAALDYTLPSGNNHVHFNHQMGEECVMEPEEAAKTLCALNIFCTSGLQGSSTVNGAPPLYVTIKENNLFRSLILSLVVKEKSLLPYDKPAVYWRNRDSVVPGEEVAKTSLLYGMTFPCRRVLLKQDCDGKVRKIYLQKGRRYTAFEAWTDPHVSYLFKEKGRSTIKPSLDKEPWRNIGSIIQSGVEAPLVVSQIVNDGLLKTINVSTYGVVTNQASYYDTQRGEMAISLEIAQNIVKVKNMQKAIEESESISKLLYKALKLIGINKESGHDRKLGESQIAQTISFFFHECKEIFFHSYCPDLTNCNINTEGDLQNLYEKWLDNIRRVCIRRFDECANNINATGRYLIQIERAKSFLLSKIYS